MLDSRSKSTTSGGSCSSAHSKPAFFLSPHPRGGSATPPQPSFAPSLVLCLLLFFCLTHMQKFCFSDCCGQTLDFPFVCVSFFCGGGGGGGSVFVTQLTMEGLMTHCCLKGNSQQHWTLLTVTLRTLPWRQTPVCGCPLVVTLLFLVKLNNSAVFLPEVPPLFLPFPAFVREGKTSRVKDCRCCTRERAEGRRWRQLGAGQTVEDWGRVSQQGGGQFTSGIRI